MNRQHVLKLLRRSKPEQGARFGVTRLALLGCLVDLVTEKALRLELRLNKKTISAATDDGHQWNVAPGLLRLAQSAGDVQWA